MVKTWTSGGNAQVMQRMPAIQLTVLARCVVLRKASHAHHSRVQYASSRLLRPAEVETAKCLVRRSSRAPPRSGAEGRILMEARPPGSSHEVVSDTPAQSPAMPSMSRSKVRHHSEASDSQSQPAVHSQAATLASDAIDGGRGSPLQLFGVPMNPDTVAIALVYFVQGILGLARLAVSFFFKDELDLEPAEAGFLVGLSSIPWLIKPLYGFISDGIPLFGYRRRSYLALCGLLGALSWAALSTVVDNKYGAVAAIIASSLSVAFSDVVVDSMVVERARGEPQSTAGSLQSLCWGSSATGGIISAYFSGSLVELYGTRTVFGLTAFLPLILSGVALIVREKHIESSEEDALPVPWAETEEQQDVATVGAGRAGSAAPTVSTKLDKGTCSEGREAGLWGMEDCADDRGQGADRDAGVCGGYESMDGGGREVGRHDGDGREAGPHNGDGRGAGPHDEDGSVSGRAAGFCCRDGGTGDGGTGGRDAKVPGEERGIHGSSRERGLGTVGARRGARGAAGRGTGAANEHIPSANGEGGRGPVLNEDAFFFGLVEGRSELREACVEVHRRGGKRHVVNGQASARQRAGGAVEQGPDDYSSMSTVRRSVMGEQDHPSPPTGDLLATHPSIPAGGLPSRAGRESAVVPGGVAAVGGGVWQSMSQQLQFLWETVREPAIFLPTLFIFAWQATPQSDTAMFYFTTNKLGFGAEFLGRVRLVTSAASLLGVGVYNTLLKEVPLRRIFLTTTLLGTALGMTQLLLVTGVNRTLGISDQWFAMGDSLVLTVLGQVSFMPILVLAARLCPPGVEATLFATLMSICNGGGVVGGLLGSGLTQALGVTADEFGNLPLLVILTNASSLLVLPFLHLLPKDVEMPERGTDTLADDREAEQGGAGWRGAKED